MACVFCWLCFGMDILSAPRYAYNVVNTKCLSSFATSIEHALIARMRRKHRCNLDKGSKFIQNSKGKKQNFGFRDVFLDWRVGILLEMCGYYL